MYNLKILITSTRPGRKGPLIAEWIAQHSRQFPGFQTEILDLAAINLPFMDEPNHPMMRQYTKEHTKAWSRTIDEADAFVIIAAEYNYGYTAPFKNAIDYLFHEWKNKPVAFVGYGGVAGGSRAIQLMKPVLSIFNMLPINDAVNIPYVRNYLNEAGEFVPTEDLDTAARTMLTALEKWSGVLKAARSEG